MSDETNQPQAAPLVPASRSAEARYEQCPHCGNQTLIEPSAGLIFRCGICGKARVPLDLPGYERTDGEVPALQRASMAHLAAQGWGAGGVVLLAFAGVGLLALGLVLTALNPGLVPLLFGVLIALLPAGLGAYGLKRAGQLKAQIGPALDEAWLSVAREVIEAQGTMDDARLAKILKVSRERAEQLLVQLSSTTPVRHRLDSADPLTFEAPRVRVPSAEAAAGDDEADDDELAEAEAEEKRRKKAKRRREKS